MSFGDNCFAENLQMFGLPAETQPEKYNLYNGLRNMATDMYNMESKMNNMENELQEIKRIVVEIKRNV